MMNSPARSKGLRLALSPLSPNDRGITSLKWNGRQSSVEKRQSSEKRPRLFSPTKRKRRGISSLTHSSVSYNSERDELSSATKKAKYDKDLNKSSSPHPQGCSSLIDTTPKSNSFNSPISIFDFDLNIRRVPWPKSTLVQEAYIAAIQPSTEAILTADNISLSHQQKLRISGCSLLSFEDVILPSIFANLQDSFRYLEGKAKGYKDSFAVTAFRCGRIALHECLDRSLEAVWECRSNEAREEEEKEAKMKEIRKQQREQERVEKKIKQEQLAKERETAKTLLLMQKKAEEDKQRRERMKNWPRNKELWNEVAILMTDLRRLEKEEKLWKEASEILDKLEAESKERIQTVVAVDEAFTANQTTLLLDQCLNIEPTLDHCAVSASRIKCMTETIDNLAAEADSVRRSVYDAYTNRHKFRGYLGATDPKALIRALALG